DDDWRRWGRVAAGRQSVLYVDERVRQLAVMHLDELKRIGVLAFAADEVLAAPILGRRRRADEPDGTFDRTATCRRGLLLSGRLRARLGIPRLALVAAERDSCDREDESERPMRLAARDHAGTLDRGSRAV